MVSGPRVLADHEKHTEQDEGQGGRSEIGKGPLRKQGAQHGRAENVSGSEGNYQSQAASGESELAAEPAGADGEDGEAERDDEDEPEEEASHGREFVRTRRLADGEGPG